MAETYVLTVSRSPHGEDELKITTPQDPEVINVTLTYIDAKIARYQVLLDLWKARKTAYSELKK